MNIARKLYNEDASDILRVVSRFIPYVFWEQKMMTVSIDLLFAS